MRWEGVRGSEVEEEGKDGIQKLIPRNISRLHYLCVLCQCYLQ